METVIFRTFFDGWRDGPDYRIFKDPNIAAMRLQQVRAKQAMGADGWHYMLASWHNWRFRRHSAGRGNDAGFGPHKAYLKFERSVEVLKKLYREEQVRRQAAFESNLITAGHMLYLGEDEVVGSTISSFGLNDWED